MSFLDTEGDDAFQAAADAAEAELESGTAVGDEGLEESNPEPTEPAEAPPVVEASGDAGTEPAPAGEANWWDSLPETVTLPNGQVVPRQELLGGGLRQADYTRKTQELAAKRQYAEWGEQTLMALRQDPVGTLRGIAEQMKLIPQGQQEYDPSEDPDPAMLAVAGLRSEFEEHQQRLDRLAEARMIEEAKAELRDMQARYPDFGEEAMKLVIELGQREDNPVGLTMEQGYWLWKGQQAVKSEAAAAAAKQKAEQEAAVLASARQAQVAPGHSAAANVEGDDNRYAGLTGGDLLEAIASDEFGGRYND
jgi:hypothetical protein